MISYRVTRKDTLFTLRYTTTLSTLGIMEGFLSLRSLSWEPFRKVNQYLKDFKDWVACFHSPIPRSCCAFTMATNYLPYQRLAWQSGCIPSAAPAAVLRDCIHTGWGECQCRVFYSHFAFAIGLIMCVTASRQKGSSYGYH